MEAAALALDYALLVLCVSWEVLSSLVLKVNRAVHRYGKKSSDAPDLRLGIRDSR